MDENEILESVKSWDEYQLKLNNSWPEKYTEEDRKKRLEYLSSCHFEEFVRTYFHDYVPHESKQ